MKEFIQMRRDRMTFALMIGVPVMQLLLFGFAINTDPRHLPTVVHIADDSVYARSIGAALKNSELFRHRRDGAHAAGGRAHAGRRRGRVRDHGAGQFRARPGARRRRRNC